MYIVVFVTAANKAEAEKIAQVLLNKRCAACVNIVDKIDSFFWWQNKIDAASEALLIIKSKKTRLKAIIKAVKSVHSYEAPEIIALPIVGGEKQYLRWIHDSTRTRT